MAVPKRFSVLRFFGNLLKVLAWIVLVVAIIAAIAIGVAGALIGPTVTDIVPGASTWVSTGGIVPGLVLLLLGLVYFLLFYVAGELVQLQLAVEENTRLTAALLLRMHQESQNGNPANYGPAGFVSEPFEGP